MHTLHHPETHPQAGFTLIEVLVSIVIISVGLLGVASMQYVGLRDSNRSGERSQATIMAYDIADRMRSNPQAVYAGQYQMDADAPPDAPDETCTAEFCTSAQLAALDTFSWSTNLGQALPMGLGDISCTDANAADALTCSPGSIHSITVMWNEQRTGASGTNCSGNLDTDLLCLTVDFQL